MEERKSWEIENFMVALEVKTDLDLKMMFKKEKCFERWLGTTIMRT